WCLVATLGSLPDEGSYTNEVTATGTDPAGTVVADTDSWSADVASALDPAEEADHELTFTYQTFRPGQEPYAMSTRFLHPARAAAPALATALVGPPAGPAAPAPTTTVTPTGPAAAAAHSEAVPLSWDGRSYAATTTESFLGTPVTVPGDNASRTLLVRNDGPT